MVSTRSFRDLAAYQHAVALANDVRDEVPCWDSFDRWTGGIQLVRAADSIGANIAEATGRWHGPDRRRLFFVARGSLYETEHWILLANARGLLENRFGVKLAELARTLNGLINRTTDRVVAR